MIEYPSDWKVVKLGALSSLITKGTTPTSLGHGFVPSGIAFIKAEAISDSGAFLKDKFCYIDEETDKLLQRSKLSVGDFLFSIAGVLGRIGRVSADILPANTNQALAIIRLVDAVDASSEYLFHWLKSDYVGKFIYNENVAAAQANLSLENVRDIPVILPPLPEQKRIAKVLDDVDRLIENLGKRVAKKRLIKKGIAQELLTGKRRLPGFEGEWKTAGFLDVFIHIASKPYQIQASEYQERGEYPVIDQGQNDVVGYTNSSAHVFQTSDDGVIIFGDHTRIVKYRKGVFVIGADGTQLLEGKNVSTEFLAHILKNLDIPNLGYSRHFKYVKDAIYKIPKDITEQRAIAKVLSDMDEEIANLEARQAKLKLVKKGMLQDLLTGKVRLKG